MVKHTLSFKFQNQKCILMVSTMRWVCSSVDNQTLIYEKFPFCVSVTLTYHDHWACERLQQEHTVVRWNFNDECLLGAEGASPQPDWSVKMHRNPLWYIKNCGQGGTNPFGGKKKNIQEIEVHINAEERSHPCFPWHATHCCQLRKCLLS